MKAITCKYHGPSATRGSRISATDHDGNRVTIDYPHDAHSHEEKYRRAALALCDKMNWSGAETLIGGYAAERPTTTYVFVFAERAHESIDALTTENTRLTVEVGTLRRQLQEAVAALNNLVLSVEGMDQDTLDADFESARDAARAAVANATAA